jgi:hypothetical protein
MGALVPLSFSKFVGGRRVSHKIRGCIDSVPFPDLKLALFIFCPTLDGDANCLAHRSITAKRFSAPGCRPNNAIMQLYRMEVLLR